MIRAGAATLLMLASFSAASAAEYDYEEMWGTRDPVVCGPFTTDQVPADGFNAVLATSIYQCALEANAVGGEYYLNLVEDISLRVAKPRQVGSDLSDYDLDDIDPDYPIYPMRVTQTSVRCHIISDILENQGKNCRETPDAGEGVCYVTLYGEWSCHAYVTATGPTVHELPPRRS